MDSETNFEPPSIRPNWADAVEAWAGLMNASDRVMEHLMPIVVADYPHRTHFEVAKDLFNYYIVRGFGGHDIEIYNARKSLRHGDMSPESKELKTAYSNLMRRVNRCRARLGNELYGRPEGLPTPPDIKRLSVRDETPASESASEVESSTPEPSTLADRMEPVAGAVVRYREPEPESEDESEDEDEEQTPADIVLTLRVPPRLRRKLLGFLHDNQFVLDDDVYVVID